MAATFTNAGPITSIAPILLLSYSATQESSNVFHRIVGARAPYVSLGAAGLRQGVHELLFNDEEDALEAVDFFAQNGTFTLVYPERLSMQMDFVVDEQGVEHELDEATRRNWLVRVAYREVD